MVYNMKVGYRQTAELTTEMREVFDTEDQISFFDVPSQ